MSASVWFEEVYTGLIKEIKKTVLYQDKKGNLVALGDNAIVVRKPEEDLKFEVFPCVSLYVVDYKHDPLRYDPFPVVVGQDIDNKVVTLEDTAVPFNLTCQIDFWSRYQSDMDSMTRSWLLKHFRQFNLPVIDNGGVERTCNCTIQGNITKSDLVLNKERLFHTIIKYQIWVELDEEMCYNEPMVTETKLGLMPQ